MSEARAARPGSKCSYAGTPLPDSLQSARLALLRAVAAELHLHAWTHLESVNELAHPPAGPLYGQP